MTIRCEHSSAFLRAAYRSLAYALAINHWQTVESGLVFSPGLYFGEVCSWNTDVIFFPIHINNIIRHLPICFMTVGNQWKPKPIFYRGGLTRMARGVLQKRVHVVSAAVLVIITESFRPFFTVDVDSRYSRSARCVVCRTKSCKVGFAAINLVSSVRRAFGLGWLLRESLVRVRQRRKWKHYVWRFTFRTRSYDPSRFLRRPRDRNTTTGRPGFHGEWLFSSRDRFRLSTRPVGFGLLRARSYT